MLNRCKKIDKCQWLKEQNFFRPVTQTWERIEARARLVEMHGDGGGGDGGERVVG
jgi:hypothetical protein